MHLFRNYDFDIVNVISIVGGVLYYAGSGTMPYISQKFWIRLLTNSTVLFPHMVASLYTNDIIRGGLMSCAIGGGVCGGQLIGSLIAVPGGHMRFKMMFVTACLTAFTAGLAGCTESAAAGSALATLVGIAVGVLEAIVSTTVTIVLDDQSELGTGAGVFGSVRGATGVIASKSSIRTSLIETDIKSSCDLLNGSIEQYQSKYPNRRRACFSSGWLTTNIYRGVSGCGTNLERDGDNGSSRCQWIDSRDWICGLTCCERFRLQVDLAGNSGFWASLVHCCLFVKGHRCEVIARCYSKTHCWREWQEG